MSDEKRQLTIYDIAREAQVSPATVSRVLGNTAKVRESTRNRVMEVVEKYNFTPSAVARNLSEAKSRIIGMMVADIINPYYSTLYAECQKIAEKNGYNLMIANTHSDYASEMKQMAEFKRLRAEAIIQVGGAPDAMITNSDYAEAIDRLSEDIPVIVTGKLDGTKVLQVRSDEYGAMELVMEHLLSLGHTKIALIGGRLEVLSTYEKHVRYKEILEENGIPYDENLVVMDINNHWGYNVKTGYDDIEEVYRRGGRPTAVIAVNEFVGIGAIQYLHKMGIRIPEDVSLVCYDNTYISYLASPYITSVDYDYSGYAEKLLDTCFQAINHQQPILIQHVKSKLIVRNSTGPAPKC